MNAVVKTLILGGAVVGAFAGVISHYSAEEEKQDLDKNLAELKVRYLERAGFTYSIGDADRWRDELANLTKWYEAELDDLYNRHPGLHDPDGPLHELEAAQKAGRMSSADFQARKEFYDLTKAFYDQLHSGQYRPVQSSTVHGVRFDLLGIQRATNEGRSRLRVDVAVWGAPRREVVSHEQGQASTAKMTLDLSFQKLSAEFIDQKSKLVGGGDTGAPEYLVDYPERWVPDFPPQAALAVWYIDPMPANAKTVNLDIGGEIRSQAGPPLPVELKASLDIQDAWKVQAGEKFEGETREMSPEEMDRAQK